MKKILIILCSLVLVIGMARFADASSILSPEANANATNYSNSAAQNGNQTTDIRFGNVPAEQSMDNQGRGYRNFPQGGNVNFPGMPGFYGETTRGALFVEIGKFLKYKDEFTLENTRNMTDDLGDIDVMPTYLCEKPEEPYNGVVKGHLEHVVDAEIIGFISLRADDDDVTSMAILGKITEIVRERGGNAFHITGDGVVRKMLARGWGIGLTGTHAAISASEGSGTVASPGLGYSAGQAGYVDFPWIQVFVLKTAQ